VVGLFLERHLSPTTIAELYNAVTGIKSSADELFRAAERVYQLQKAFNVKLGITRKDDYFVKRSVEEADGRELPFQNIDLDHPGMLKEYYKYRGYSNKGLPSLNRLREIGLNQVAKELQESNLISDDSTLSIDEIIQV